MSSYLILKYTGRSASISYSEVHWEEWPHILFWSTLEGVPSYLILKYTGRSGIISYSEVHWDECPNMHQSFVSTAPHLWWWAGMAELMSRVITFWMSLQCHVSTGIVISRRYSKDFSGVTSRRNSPSRHTTSKWCHINVDATWSRRIDVDTTSF